MGIAEDWADLVYNLDCLSKGAAKRKFRKSIKYGWGGLCAYCRSKRAETLDHIKPRSKGGSSLRSNMLPCCRDCNHSKGSSPWLTWFKEQNFYNKVAQELIEEWISNKRFIEEELDECTTFHRTEICIEPSEIRSITNEQTSFRENSIEVA